MNFKTLFKVMIYIRTEKQNLFNSNKNTQLSILKIVQINVI